MASEKRHPSIDNETHTCERCAPINFTNLDKTAFERLEALIYIDDLSQPLTDRHCHTCQILQDTIDVHRLQYTSVRVSWRRRRDDGDPMGTLEFQYSKGDTRKTLKPDLAVYDDMARPGRVKTQNAPRRVDFEQAKTWVHACKLSHSLCTTNFSEGLESLRVIDCVTMNVIPAPKDCVYVALSYVWGDSATCNISRSSALLEQMPLTVKHSLDATLMLGYRYLWVDKYCIDQGNAADKHYQINQMGDIYSSAAVTLVAAAGANSSYGLPGVERDREHPRHDVTLGRLRFVTTYKWNIDEIYHSAWCSRAWTFQEGYMSKRRLYFTDTRLFYICSQEVRCDAETGYKPTWYDTLSHLSPSLPINGLEVDFKNHMLTEYTRRKLTFNSDALNGIVGVLNTFSKARRPIFHTWGVTFGGLPRAIVPHSLAITLTWFHDAPCFRRKAFPSWSPLGWEGVAKYDYNPTPVISRSFQVEVWDNSKFIQLSKVKENLNQRVGAEILEKSRYLKITAKLSWLELRYFSASELLSIDKSRVAVDELPWLIKPRAGFHVRVPTGDNVEVYASMLPCWDSEPDLSLDLPRVPCALIPKDDEAQHITVIMLQHHSTHYERIGSFNYLYTHAGRTNFFFKDDNGALTVERVLEQPRSYIVEEVARDFNNQEMQTFLLG